MFNSDFVEKLKLISDEERNELLSSLSSSFIPDKFNNENLDLKLLDSLQKKRKEMVIPCPHCGCAEHIIGHGFQNGKRRYKCTVCNRTFSENVYAFSYYLHKTHKLENYISCMINSMTLRKSASIVEISLSTSFIWRHKILAALEFLFSHKQKDIVEFSCMEADYSEKGTKNKIEKEENLNIPVSILVSTDRNEHLSMKVAGRDIPSKTKIKEYFEENIECNSTICIEKKDKFNILQNGKYRIYCINNNEDKLIRNEAKNLNNINQITFQYLLWGNSFRGVASKYLQNYLNWFVFLSQLTKCKLPVELFYAECMKSNSAWKLMRKMRVTPLLV